MKKQNLVSVYNHTINWCLQKRFRTELPVVYNYAATNLSDEKFLDSYQPLEKNVQVLVGNIDSFDMARLMNDSNDSNDSILVLNLASDKKSGGGVSSGARAQEEELYRKSNYFQANHQDLYPLDISESIYSPIVHIIKDSKYNLLNNPVSVSCLAIAAIRNPKLKIGPNGKTTYLYDTDRKIMQDKIDSIFKIAMLNKHQELILGALGCGVFNNPTEEVAKMFKQSINTYKRYFRRIGFAILSGAGNSNYDIFYRIMNE